MSSALADRLPPTSFRTLDRVRQLEDLESALMGRMLHNTNEIARISTSDLDMSSLDDDVEEIAHHAARLARLDHALGAVRAALDPAGATP